MSTGKAQHLGLPWRLWRLQADPGPTEPPSFQHSTLERIQIKKTRRRWPQEPLWSLGPASLKWRWTTSFTAELYGDRHARTHARRKHAAGSDAAQEEGVNLLSTYCVLGQSRANGEGADVRQWI